MAAKLTPEQAEECKEIFALFDADEDGRIATGEVVAALRSLGQNVDEAEARRFLEDAGAGAVDLAAFLAVAARKAGARQSAERLAGCFDVFDDAQSGSIPAEQLREVMVRHGDRLTEEEADAMLREADPRGEGRVDYKSTSRSCSGTSDHPVIRPSPPVATSDAAEIGQDDGGLLRFSICGYAFSCVGSDDPMMNSQFLV